MTWPSGAVREVSTTPSCASGRSPPAAPGCWKPASISWTSGSAAVQTWPSFAAHSGVSARADGGDTSEPSSVRVSRAVVPEGCIVNPLDPQLRLELPHLHRQGEAVGLRDHADEPARLGPLHVA